MRPLIGAIAWLKPEDEIDDHLPVGLNAGACNHPCLIIDVQAVQPVQQARILIITAFSGKTRTERELTIYGRDDLLAILPNDTYKSLDVGRSVELTGSKRLRVDSWVRTNPVHTVPMTFLRAYRGYGPPTADFKLNRTSLSKIEKLTGVRPASTSSLARLAEGTDDVCAYKTPTASPLPSLNTIWRTFYTTVLIVLPAGALGATGYGIYLLVKTVIGWVLRVSYSMIHGFSGCMVAAQAAWRFGSRLGFRIVGNLGPLIMRVDAGVSRAAERVAAVFKALQGMRQ